MILKTEMAEGVSAFSGSVGEGSDSGSVAVWACGSDSGSVGVGAGRAGAASALGSARIPKFEVLERRRGLAAQAHQVPPTSEFGFSACEGAFGGEFHAVGFGGFVLELCEFAEAEFRVARDEDFSAHLVFLEANDTFPILCHIISHIVTLLEKSAF